MDAADEQGRLSVLILHIGLNATSDQELDHIFFVAAAGNVEWSGQLSIYQVSLCSSPLQKEHEHFGVAKLGCLVQHRLSLGVIHVLLFDVIQV